MAPAERQGIKVFIRIRPSARASKGFMPPQVQPDPDGVMRGIVTFEKDKDNVGDGRVDNSKTTFKFQFDGILSMRITQEQVFNCVAKPVIDDVLNGINGTIFAYGQTGSGKTFTITGAADRYEDRGLIPRTISYIFRAFQQGGANYRLYVSYLEIYNDAGYDLLTRAEGTTQLEDLPKVALREDEDGNIHLRNLSVNMAQKEEDALNLLFLGDTNRVVAETPMNDASTRSHCMFILWVDSTKPDSDTVRRAKLHLVDLAGSERISKTGVEGNLQREARYINLSLHHLEQVIVALQERSEGRRAHVPYRNSTMTSVLRDSLGGNCKTVMVGAAAVEDTNIDEAISTCRFAQRVACIKNTAKINEELDPSLLIKRLKKEVAELKDELKLMSGVDEEEEITAKDVSECEGLVSTYLEETDFEKKFVCGSARRFRECFRILREAYWHRLAEGGGGGGGSKGSRALPDGQHGAPQSSAAAVGSIEATVLELRRQVSQRDQELGILVGALRKRGDKATTAPQPGRPFIQKGQPEGAAQAEASAPPPEPGGTPALANGAHGGPAGATGPVDQAPAPMDSATLLVDRNKAFDVFRRSVRRTESLQDNRQAMMQLKAEAKGLGEKANAARTAIASKQQQIERMRVERAMEAGPKADSGAPPPDSPEVVALLAEIKEQKNIYQQCMQRLQQVKVELDEFQKAVEKNKERLQRDFEAWYASLQASSDPAGALGGALGGGAGTPAGGPSPVAATASAEASRASAEMLRASIHSQASSADSHARVTPARGPSPARSPAASASGSAPPVVPGHAWSQGSLSSSAAGASAGAVGGVGPKAGPLVGSSPAQAAAPSASQAGSKVASTGDAQTDSDIAAYFAAIAELQR
eukprot:TRINITY_DN39414_c0_g1_i1.p1 TRINITY_DN39414_c0_g1~~TRINITY_DN39414_c0_g1_i1.p1  ORF type:complete len:872 (+),score=222.76 TRINITY_DN39414_c0_g1_i1:87-2702(+)